MAAEDAAIDDVLCAALHGDNAPWPDGCPADLGFERIGYHGIAGLIAERAGGLTSWPAELLGLVQNQAVAQAMWELRHKEVLAQLVAAFANENVRALLLKGTALAYDLYRTPAARARGDTDLLIASSDLDRARSVLSGLGYRSSRPDDAKADQHGLQEEWRLACADGTSHSIDLHWQLLNAPALSGVLQFDDCGKDARPLPRLSPDAMAMDRIRTLLHTCIHRAMHITSPYVVDGQTYYGGDRLIWANDIHLLAMALSDAEWRQLTALALSQGVAAVCLDGLNIARSRLGAEVPVWVSNELASAGREKASDYLLKSQQMGRAWSDLFAISGWRAKLAYVRSRSVPSPDFVRAKYPKMANMPLGLLYARRVAELIRPRPKRGQG